MGEGAEVKAFIKNTLGGLLMVALFFSALTLAQIAEQLK